MVNFSTVCYREQMLFAVMDEQTYPELAQGILDVDAGWAESWKCSGNVL